jgi:beta-glucosidase
LEVGESKEVSFKIDRELLKFYNSELEWVAEPGEFEVFIGGSSMDIQKMELELK